jgi:hypothetical protein
MVVQTRARGYCGLLRCGSLVRRQASKGVSIVPALRGALSEPHTMLHRAFPRPLSCTRTPTHSWMAAGGVGGGVIGPLLR